MSFFARIWAFFAFAFFSASKAASIKADIVFATSTPLTIAIPAVYASRKNNIPMVFEVRDLWPELPIAVGALKNPLLIFMAKWLEKYAYKCSSKIVALSPGMKEGVEKVVGHSKNVEVIPNSCDIELFYISDEKDKSFRTSHAWLGDRPLVVYSGTMGIINGVEYLARLAEETKKIDPEIRFLLVGGGKEEGKVRNTALKLGVYNETFYMFPKVAKLEMPSIVNASSIMISLFIDIKEMWNNSANKFFDALAAGKPIAINYRGWQADLLERTGAGIILDAGDVRKAARDLVGFLRDQKRIDQAKVASRKLALEEFSRDILAKKFEQVLLDAVKMSV